MTAPTTSTAPKPGLTRLTPVAPSPRRQPASSDIAGAVEETTAAEAQALFDTNFFGVHRVTGAVLPHLREQGAGRIVVVGSLAGLVPVPLDACCTATKHAVEVWIEALQFEVAPFGVRCTIVEPGFVRLPVRECKQVTASRLPAHDLTRHRVEASSTAASPPAHHPTASPGRSPGSSTPDGHHCVARSARTPAAPPPCTPCCPAPRSKPVCADGSDPVDPGRPPRRS